MASKKPADWILVKTERIEDPDRPDSKAWRGEVIHKGETLWIIDADTEEELEDRAWEVKRKALNMIGEDIDGDPDADLTTVMDLE